jgi:excisionase family DNA binding protein
VSDARLHIDLPDELVERIAELAAAIVLERLEAQRPPASEYLTVLEAAELLRCRRQRVDNLLSAGRLTRFKEGGRTLLLRAEVEGLVVAEREAHRRPNPPRGRSGSGVQR